MSIFKKRSKEVKIEKTLTILDSETKEIKEVIDIIVPSEPDVKILELKDKEPEVVIEDKLLKELKDAYPEVEDHEQFIKNAFVAHKEKLDLDKQELTDEQKKEEEKRLEALAKSEVVAAKILADAAKKEQESADARQKEIEEAERARHEAAQKK